MASFNDINIMPLLFNCSTSSNKSLVLRANLLGGRVLMGQKRQ